VSLCNSNFEVNYSNTKIVFFFIRRTNQKLIAHIFEKMIIYLQKCAQNRISLQLFGDPHHVGKKNKQARRGQPNVGVPHLQLSVGPTSRHHVYRLLPQSCTYIFHAPGPRLHDYELKHRHTFQFSLAVPTTRNGNRSSSKTVDTPGPCTTDVGRRATGTDRWTQTTFESLQNGGGHLANITDRPPRRPPSHPLRFSLGLARSLPRPRAPSTNHHHPRPQRRAREGSAGRAR
jgi:hypothetical protein